MRSLAIFNGDMRLVPSAIVLLGIFSSACDYLDQNYFPLQAGNTWRYEASLKTVDRMFNQKAILSSLPKILLKDKKTYIHKSSNGSQFFYQADETGVFQIGHTDVNGIMKSAENKGHYLFRYPLMVGKEWRDNIRTKTLKITGPRSIVIEEYVPVKVKITSINETVSVPAGTYKNCLRVDMHGQATIPKGKYGFMDETFITLEDSKWYAPGVGLIKSIRKESTTSKNVDQGEYILTLESFTRK